LGLKKPSDRDEIATLECLARRALKIFYHL